MTKDALKVSWYDLDGNVPDKFVAEDIICIPVSELSDFLCDLLSDEYDIDVDDYEFIIAKRKEEDVLDSHTVESLIAQLELSKQYLPESLAISNDVLIGKLKGASNR